MSGTGSTGTQSVPPGPRGRGGGSKTLWGGIAVVAAGGLAFYYSLASHQESKEQRDPTTGGQVPTWEYRIQQAQAPPTGPAENPATLRSQEREKEPPKGEKT